MNLTHINKSVFRKVKPDGTLELDGKKLVIYNPATVSGKVVISPICPPKTDFDEYYKDNLAYFNLYSSTVISEYFELCENAIEKQKVQSEAVNVGKQLAMGGIYAWYYVSFVFLGMWGFMQFISAAFRH